VDIKHGEKEVAQRENHPWTAERRAQLEFCIAAAPREERFQNSFFTITSDLNRRRCPSTYWLKCMNRSKQVPADLPAKSSEIAAASNAGVRLITQENPLKCVHTPGKKAPNPTVGAYSLRRLVPRSLEYIGVTPFANLVREDVSTKPPNWTGDVKEYPLVKGAHLREANMQYADGYRAFLVNADMNAAQLSNAHLSEANLANADLSYADLANADLSYANLSNADLSVANLSGADLGEAYLKGVDLRKAKGLSKSQLNNAKTDEHTLLPADLPP
jgi:hypothetical protein